MAIPTKKGKEKKRMCEKKAKNNNKLINKKDGKDNIRCLDGLKTERQSMQKLEESC